MKIIKDEMGNVYIGKEKKYNEMTDEEKKMYLNDLKKQMAEFNDDQELSILFEINENI